MEEGISGSFNNDRKAPLSESDIILGIVELFSFKGEFLVFNFA